MTEEIVQIFFLNHTQDEKHTVHFILKVFETTEELKKIPKATREIEVNFQNILQVAENDKQHTHNQRDIKTT